MLIHLFCVVKKGCDSLLSKSFVGSSCVGITVLCSEELNFKIHVSIWESLFLEEPDVLGEEFSDFLILVIEHIHTCFNLNFWFFMHFINEILSMLLVF